MGNRRGRTGGVIVVMVLLHLLLVGGAGRGTAAASAGAVVASGLISPRFLAVAEDGALYVSEAGAGGAEPLAQAPGATRGTTGRVTRVAPGGAKTVVAADLPSYLGTGYGGPAGLVLADGALWLAIGRPAQVTTQVAPFPNDGAVVRIDPRTGAVTKVADILAYEKANNPDGFSVESNLYGMALGADGNLYVADAGGNTLYRVNPRTGELAVAAVFAGLPTSRANQNRGGKNELDPVPTGVAAGPDRSIYVGLLPGGPPAPGGAKVVRVAPAGTVSDAATGPTTINSVAFGPDGLLYIGEFSAGRDATAQPPVTLPGRVLRVLADGTTQIVADGLEYPNGITFDRAGNLYVAVSPTISGAPPPGEPRGQVLRFDGVASPPPGLPRTGGGGLVPQDGPPWTFALVAALAGLVALARTLKRPALG